MATSLGYFFRHYPDCFKNLDALAINGGGVDLFKKYIASHPDDLNDYINKKILPESVYNEYRNFKWIDEMGGNDEKLTRFVDTILEMKKEFEIAMQEALNQEKYSEADYFSRQITALKKEKVIKCLSKYCVIPKYGFPVDVVDLQIYSGGVPVNKYDMSRDLKIAI